MHLGSAKHHENKAADMADKEFPGWKFEYKDVWTNDSVIKLSCEVNIRSIHKEENYNICVGWWRKSCKCN